VNREIERGERVWGRFGNLIRWRAVVVEKENKKKKRYCRWDMMGTCGMGLAGAGLPKGRSWLA
jgi:hypothetical protein